MGFFSKTFRPSDKFTTAEVAFLINLADSGGGTFTILTTTDKVDGINKVFGFTSQPSLVVSDGGQYQAKDNNGNTQWTWDSVAKQVTMSLAPQYSIFGLS